MDTETVAKRITDRISIEDRGHSTPCWVSNRAMQSNGYTKTGYLGKTWLTHRLAYTAFIGEIPTDKQIDHLCSVRQCCNPEHLEPVSSRENLLRGDTITAREAATTHCPRGHEYTSENTYRRPDGLNKRDCRACRNTYRKRHAPGRTAHQQHD